jgi:GH3 auxin-responsive promoter
VFFRRVPLWLAQAPFVRRVVNALFSTRARRHLAELDAEPVARNQTRILTGLVHEAQNTRFGLDHDFRRIRTVADFRRLVPLRTPGQLWRDYWQPAYPRPGGVTWPGPFASFTLPDQRVRGELPWIPVSHALERAHEHAAFTALSLALHAAPHRPLLRGKLVVLDEAPDGPPWDALANGRPRHAVLAHEEPPTSGLARLATPPVSGRPAVVPAKEHAPWPLEDPDAPVTCLAGTAEHLCRFLNPQPPACERTSLREVWPELAAAFYLRGADDPPRDELVREHGPDQLAGILREVCLRPEGPIAVEDPRTECLRLLTDHGVYFEFVPADQVDQARPVRHGAAEIEPGVRYAVALSSPAGWWACLTGLEVCFERRDPPLLRLLRAGKKLRTPVEEAAALSPPHPFPPQPPHARSAGRRELPLLGDRP